MAKLGQVYKVDDLGEMDSFDPIPKGTYRALVVDSEMKENSAKSGHYLELQIDITEGDYRGRKIYERLNLDNPNEQAAAIARKALGSLCKALNILEKIEDSSALHNKPFLMDVDIQEGKEYTDKTTGEKKPGRPQNRIRKFHPFSSSSAPAAQAASPAPVEAKAAASGGGAPWDK